MWYTSLTILGPIMFVVIICAWVCSGGKYLIPLTSSHQLKRNFSLSNNSFSFLVQISFDSFQLKNLFLPKIYILTNFHSYLVKIASGGLSFEHLSLLCENRVGHRTICSRLKVMWFEQHPYPQLFSTVGALVVIRVEGVSIHPFFPTFCSQAKKAI